jgi:bacteriocin-like protein
MNTLIQPQIEIELTDEQLASISGGFDGDDRGHRHDWDDHRDHNWDDRGHGDWGDRGRRSWY